MKNKFVLILIVGCFLLLTCFSCVRKYKNMYHFTEDDYTMINIYKADSTYILKMENETDTLIVKNVTIYDNSSNFYIDESTPGPDYHALAYIDAQLVHKSTKIPFSAVYEKYANEVDPRISIVIGELYAFDICDKRNFKKDGIYNDTIIIDSLNSKKGYEWPGKFEIEYLQWHKKKGIVKYKIRDFR